MKPHASLAALVACLSPLAAQTVSVSLTALTPLTVQVSDATSANQATWPLGPMPDFGGILASLPSGAPGFASTDWNTYASDRAAVASITHQVYNPQALTGFSGEAGPDEFLVEFSSATPVTARLQISRWTDLTIGAPWPTIQIDFDNDGVIDVASLSASQGALLLPSFGPQPLQLRVIMTATLGSQVQSFNRVALVLTPENNLTIATPVAASVIPCLSTSFSTSRR